MLIPITANPGALLEEGIIPLVVAFGAVEAVVAVAAADKKISRDGIFQLIRLQQSVKDFVFFCYIVYRDELHVFSILSGLKDAVARKIHKVISCGLVAEPKSSF